MSEYKQKSTFTKTVDNTEHSLSLLYKENQRQVFEDLASLSAATQAPNSVHEVTMGPDLVIITLKSTDSERVLKLTGSEYLEVRKLFSLDVDAHRRYL